jgi:carboxypeptidase C (cathepsin A)
MVRQKYRWFATAAVTALCLLATGLAAGQEVAVEIQQQKEDQPLAPPTAFVTQHSGRFNGARVDYTVTAGETYLRDASGEPKAAIFTFAYTKKDVADSATRPVTFVWNGGPGSASVWLHMGSIGPRRIVVPSDAAYPGPPPYRLADAPETILDVTDLVFVDPVGTGFSRALGTHENKEFWGLTEDARSMAEFIRDWITAQGRWNSPRFLLGESFGSTRAAAVANLLEKNFMISLNGIVFISQALDYTGSTPYLPDNLIANVTYLPTMAAAALYHGKVSPPPASLEAFLRDAREFATAELLPALFRGSTLDQASHDHVRDRLAYFTGLSPEYIERVNLRVGGFRFAKELLRDRGLAIGLLDARYTRDDMDDVAETAEADATDASISPAFKAALMDYMHRDLGVSWDRLYLAPADAELEKSWRWRPVPDGQSWEPAPVNTARDLSSALRSNPRLRVMVAAGYYDLVTPFFDAEYTLNRHDIQPGRVDYHYYPAGHMMYVNEPSRTALLADIRQFIRQQTGTVGGAG